MPNNEYAHIEKCINISFPKQPTYCVEVTPRVPEERPFIGYTDNMPSHGVGWSNPRVFVVAYERTGWYKTYQVKRVPVEREVDWFFAILN